MSFFERICELFGGCHKTKDYATVTVQKGDTLSGIAKELGGDAEDYKKLVELNPEIKDPDLIHPGQVLKIPNDWA
jgi:nucleoid-associated protein YgaU